LGAVTTPTTINNQLAIIEELEEKGWRSFAADDA
jgi:hypothetical protein